MATKLGSLLLAYLIATIQAEYCSAGELLDDLSDGFSATVPVYSWVRNINVYKDSLLNPKNDIASIPDTEDLIEVRPDVLQNYRNISIDVKPRMSGTYKSFDSPETENETNKDIYINEAGVRVAFTDSMVLSLAREVLLWGPSMFLSVSNPFFLNNGRADPFAELGGRDIARAAYVPDSSWTVNFMRNYGIGRDVEPVDGFHPVSALKIDYLGQAYYSSLVLSNERKENNRIGGYLGVTATSALLLYAEATTIKGTNVYYPTKVGSPDSIQMLRNEDQRIRYTTVLVGAGYTFLNGLTMNIEYLHNSPGYNNTQADAYYSLAEKASQQYLMGGSASLLGDVNRTNLSLLRKNYIFTQLNYPDPDGELDWTVRYSRNIDDDSSSVNTSVTWALSDNWNIFFLGVLNKGDRNTEYGLYYNSLAQLGVKYYLW